MYGRDVAEPGGQRGDRRRNAVNAQIDGVIGLMLTSGNDAERCGINAAAAAAAANALHLRQTQIAKQRACNLPSVTCMIEHLGSNNHYYGRPI